MNRLTIEASRTASAARVKPIPRWQAWLRSMRPFRVIASRSLRGPYERSQFLSAIQDVSNEAIQRRTIHAKTVGLWRLEKLGFAYCRHGKGNLNEQDIPLTVRPIVHVGLGIAATETAGFSADRISELIDSRADPAFRLFGFESIGCIWAVQANKLLYTVFRIFSRTKMPPFKVGTWRRFVGQFPRDVRKLLAHGYGRTLYFKHHHIQNAVREATSIDSLHTYSAVHGIAFAFAMLNHVELSNVLATRLSNSDRESQAAFRDGLVYALAFWEWAYDGFLETPCLAEHPTLVDAARDLVESSRDNGKLSVFGVL